MEVPNSQAWLRELESKVGRAVGFRLESQPRPVELLARHAFTYVAGVAVLGSCAALVVGVSLRTPLPVVALGVVLALPLWIAWRIRALYSQPAIWVRSDGLEVASERLLWAQIVSIEVSGLLTVRYLDSFGLERVLVRPAPWRSMAWWSVFSVSRRAECVLSRDAKAEKGDPADVDEGEGRPG